MFKLTFLLAVVWAAQAADAFSLTYPNLTNHFPHYATYAFGQPPQEAVHRVRWHDGYNGPELVRLEMFTNAVPWGGDLHTSWAGGSAHYKHIKHTRMLRIITPEQTNEVVVKELGVEMKLVEPVEPLEKLADRLRNLLDKQDRILDELQQKLATLTNITVTRVWNTDGTYKPRTNFNATVKDIWEIDEDGVFRQRSR